jgi:hypothetical protein
MKKLKQTMIGEERKKCVFDWKQENEAFLNDVLGFETGHQYRFLAGILFAPSSSNVIVPQLQDVIQADGAPSPSPLPTPFLPTPSQLPFPSPLQSLPAQPKAQPFLTLWLAVDCCVDAAAATTATTAAAVVTDIVVATTASAINIAASAAAAPATTVDTAAIIDVIAVVAAA